MYDELMDPFFMQAEGDDPETLEEKDADEVDDEAEEEADPPEADK